MLKDAIKCLFKNKNTGKPSLSIWFVRNKRWGPNLFLDFMLKKRLLFVGLGN